MPERKEEEIAMKLNLGDWFYKHLDRMSDTSSKISEDGQVMNFKMQVLLLEAALWEYIKKAKAEEYYKSVSGWKELSVDKNNLNDRHTKHRLGESGVSAEQASLDVKEGLLKLKGLMGFAVRQNIAPGYKPAEKKIGFDIRRKPKKED